MSLDTYESTWSHERRGYIRCRTIGHSWHDYDSSNWKPTMGTPLTLRCERCGTERRDTIGATGRLITRHYFKPEGYDLKRGEIRPTRDDFRVMLLAIREERPATRRKRVAS
jgi:hypothetical protein